MTQVELFVQSDEPADYVPMPVVLIDQNADSDATVVQLSFGDRLGALIDTVKWPFIKILLPNLS